MVEDEIPEHMMELAKEKRQELIGKKKCRFKNTGSSETFS